MRATSYFFNTKKEDPQDCFLTSHKLLIKAGYIKQESCGIFSYLPTGIRVLDKIETIIRHSMNKVSLEISSPIIQPKELWEESNRWDKYGPELFRLFDRHKKEYCLGPTCEEVFLNIVKSNLTSYKQLPISLYQIKSKYRDEIRPRFGLIRSREFIMKDCYIFDKTKKDSIKSYNKMFNIYKEIFDKLQLSYTTVIADTGAIGGSLSHQFMAKSSVGESDICYCSCGYSSDLEKATCYVENISYEQKPLEKVYTKDIKKIEELVNFFNTKKENIIKSILFLNKLTNTPLLVLLRADMEVNLIKVINYLNISEHEIELASDNVIKKYSSSGFTGPFNIKAKILVDKNVLNVENPVIGSNEKDYHYKYAYYNRDYKGYIGDFTNVLKDSSCPECKKTLMFEKGIEVGQLFLLNDKYSKPMNLFYKNNKNIDKFVSMSCYGIGVSRLLSSIIEQNNDSYGICMPYFLAPFFVCVIPVDNNKAEHQKLANFIYKKLLSKGVDVIIDDRSSSFGQRLKDHMLIGIPYYIICGKESSNNIVEFFDRKNQDAKRLLNKSDVINLVTKEYKDIIKYTYK